MGAIEELQRDCAYCRQPICQCPQKACAWSLIRSSRTDAGRSSGPTTTGSERSHEALELRRKPPRRPSGRRGESAPTPVMSNSTGRSCASRLALARYCCDRVLAAEARFHDPPLPRLLVADQLRRPPCSFVPVSAHGQGFLRYLSPSKRLSVPAPATPSCVRLPGRRNGG
jgi:hypothetical protein